MPPSPPNHFMSPLPARPSMPAPYLFGWHLRALLAACLGSVALQASPPCDGALAGLGSFFSNRFVSPPRSSFFLLLLTISSNVSARFTNSINKRLRWQSLVHSFTKRISWISIVHCYTLITLICITQQQQITYHTIITAPSSASQGWQHTHRSRGRHLLTPRSILNISSETPQISIILPDSTAILALHFHPSLRDA